MYYCRKDLEKHIHNISQAIIDSTKNDLSNFHITFKNLNNNAPKNIKGDYDLSIHGNKIVLVDNKDGTTVETRCHPDDEFDIGIGINEAFKKIKQKREEEKKRKEEEDKKIKVGDWVEITNWLKGYSTYVRWLYDKVDPRYVCMFNYGTSSHNGLKGKVIAIGAHENENKNLVAFLVQGNQVYIVEDIGLKKVKNPYV